MKAAWSAGLSAAGRNERDDDQGKQANDDGKGGVAGAGHDDAAGEAASGAGTVVHLIATDPTASLDLPAWCHLTGHTYLGTVPDECPAMPRPAEIASVAICDQQSAAMNASWYIILRPKQIT